MSREDDIWITGIGAATPLGHTWDSIADGLLAGRSGIRTVTEFPVADHPSQIAGRVGTIPCPPDWPEADFAARRPLEQLALWCATTALRDAGWWDDRARVRVGMVLGVGAEWLVTWEEDARRHGLEHAAQVHDAEPLHRVLARSLGTDGPALGLSAACASGNHALAVARRWLALGWADICLAGACDMGVSPMSLASFGNLRALSRRNAEPQAASRPFDRGRDGFVVAEGGAVFVLERASSARKRGARAYAAVSGFGASSDAYHAIIPSPDPGPAVSAIRQALADACVTPDEVSYINAHATGTPVGDELEANALRIVLGAAADRVPVSSTKSMTGHLLTASGAMECIAAIVALVRQAVPPTINLDDPDPRCTLNHVAHQARAQPVDVVVSNSFGFGGSNTSLVVRRVP